MRKIIYILPALLIAWALVSFLDIIAGNISISPENWTYNLFVLLF